jgi:hypothetical protein
MPRHALCRLDEGQVAIMKVPLLAIKLIRRCGDLTTLGDAVQPDKRTMVGTKAIFFPCFRCSRENERAPAASVKICVMLSQWHSAMDRQWMSSTTVQLCSPRGSMHR